MASHDDLRRLLGSLERKALSVTEFWKSLCERCRNPADWAELRPHLAEALRANMDLCEREVISPVDLWHGVRYYLDVCPDQEAAVLSLLAGHTSVRVREFAPWLEQYFLAEKQSRDFEFLRRTSRLQPGTRLEIYGGYTAAYSPPWWLEGREQRLATFVGFAAAKVGTVPLACVEFDGEIDLTEACGRKHKGRFAVLSEWRGYNPYAPPPVAWSNMKHATVAVHVKESLPTDAAELAACYAVLPSLESHASYALSEEPANPSASGLWSKSQELGETLDSLDNEATATMAASWLSSLLRRAPEMWLLAAPALLLRLGSVGHNTVEIQRLFLDRGLTGLRFLTANFRSADAILRAELVDAVGQFGSLARDHIAGLNECLKDELPVRVAATISLWKLDGRTVDIAPMLLEGLRLEAFGEESAACLRAMGGNAGDIGPALVNLLSGDEPSPVKARAAHVLGSLGHEAAPAVPLLIELLGTTDERVQRSAFSALREIQSLAELSELVIATFGGWRQ